MPINLIIRNPLDRDAREFFARANITDAAARTQLNGFVRGVKTLGLWSSMVCWPLRSSQNAGTGTTAYSLGGLGTFNGTLVSGPVWGVNGTVFTGAGSINPNTNPRMTNGFGLPTYPMSSVVVGQRISGTGSASWNVFGDGAPSGQLRQFSKRAYANNSMLLGVFGIGIVRLVNNNVLTLSDDFEMATGIVPNDTNANADILINTTEPAASSGLGVWGTGASTSGSFECLGDLSFRLSFHATFTTAINNTAFYTLYRATLGTGLGLP
jgi:hypothetical protein